jgi:hypothetical protein
VVTRHLLAPALLLLTAAASAQTIRTYTETAAGPNSRPLGYPVPLPVESLTPVDGFRSYASLHARHQALDLASADIRGEVVGNTQQFGRPVWAYVVGDADALTMDGFAEGSFIVNANTHAREWQAPEVSTGMIEYLAANATDRGMVRYLLDNTRLVIIPVQNIDGLLQTQRFPTQVIVGQDPVDPADWPRDGRMRRKNMRDADEVLATLGDHLRGVDLNRNHAPYFGPLSGGGGSPNPNSLTFHGSAVHSEAENRALDAAIALAGPSRLRLGQDLHSFGMVFFSGNAGDNRLNAIQSTLIGRMVSHHLVASRGARFPNGRGYVQSPDPPGAGIGTAAEFFATSYLVPSWTLELEPRNSATEYGGSGDSHGGFIPPAAEIRRVREAWATTQALAFYHQAGPPRIARVTVSDAQTGERRHVSQWVRSGAGRALVVLRDLPLLRGRSYRAAIAFDKPMRWRVDGAVAQFPGLNVPLTPDIALTVAGQTATPGAGSAWTESADRTLRYRDDTFEAILQVPPGASAATARLRVAARDLAGMAIDSNPATAVDWVLGSWFGYEDEAGLDGDAGGADNTIAIRTDTVEGERVVASLQAGTLAEGRAARLILQRMAPGPALAIAAGYAGGTASAADIALSDATATWASGESGWRVVGVRAVADANAEGDEDAWIQLAVTSGVARLPTAALAVRVTNPRRTEVEAEHRCRSAAGLCPTAAPVAAEAAPTVLSTQR